MSAETIVSGLRMPFGSFNKATPPPESPVELQEDGELEESENLADLKEKAKAFVKVDPGTAKVADEIENGLGLTSSLSLQLENSETGEGNYALLLMILLGGVLNTLKPLLKKKGLKFSDWMKDRVPYISTRSAQDYMKLAKIKNAESWTFLGKNRLLEVADLLAASKAEDPMGELLKRHGLERSTVLTMPKKTLRDVWANIKDVANRDSTTDLLCRKITALEKDLQEARKTGKLNIAAELASLKMVIESFG